MGHAVLINPFNLTTGPRPKSVQSEARFTPVCARCQSDDLICHAVAQWSNGAQQWELAATFDQPVHCNPCDSQCSVTWLPLN